VATCETCTMFFEIPKDAGDYEPGKADCVTEKKDEKGKYWLSTPVFKDSEVCPGYKKSTKN